MYITPLDRSQSSLEEAVKALGKWNNAVESAYLAKVWKSQKHRVVQLTEIQISRPLSPVSPFAHYSRGVHKA